MKIPLSTLLFVLSLLPLLAYPAVLVANAMQLSALLDRSLRLKGARTLSWQRVGMGAFVIGTTAYPAVVLACWLWARSTPADARGALVSRAAPLAYLAILAGLLYLLSRAESGPEK